MRGGRALLCVICAICGLVLLGACVAPEARVTAGPGSQITAESNALKVQAALANLQTQTGDVAATVENFEASLAKLNLAVDAQANIEAAAIDLQNAAIELCNQIGTLDANVGALAVKVRDLNVGGGDNNNITTWLSLGLLGLIAIIQIFKPLWRWNRERSERRILGAGGSLPPVQSAECRVQSEGGTA